MTTLDPDRIIIMITNTGRRAFMGGPEYMGADKSAYFDANPSLYLENFPPMLGQPEGLHQVLLSRSASIGPGLDGRARARIRTPPTPTRPIDAP